MPTIAEENKKILRQALDVIVGMDIPFEDISSVSVSGNYPGSSGVINQAPQRANLMDLSNGGFLNDGLSTPLDSNTGGFVSQINTDLDISVTLSNSSDSDIVIIGYLNGDIHKWTFSGSGANRTITIPADPKRIIVSRIICGEAFWFDNANLISCNLQLRAVETKVDNPELQMSEIDIEGYEPNDITDSIGYIGTGYPIYYTSGYQDDMAPLRRFYLGEPIEFDKSVVKIKGYDATYFLDDEFGGVYAEERYEDSDGNLPGQIDLYLKEIDKMLTDSGVEHTFDPSGLHSTWPAMTFRVFIDKQPKRAVIAQIVNFFRYQFFSTDLKVNYVDAGIPSLMTGDPVKPIVTIENITKPVIHVDPIIKSIAIRTYGPVPETSAVFDTIQSDGAQIYETSEPYSTITASAGTLTYINPYTYKLAATGTVNVSGTRIQMWATWSSGYGYYLPLIVTSGDNGVDVDLGSLYIQPLFTPETLEAMMNRSNISYEFTFRGDPKLQPRDYIRADIDGSGTLIDMTIDNIELKHEGGGTTSTIVARKGFI